MNRGFRETPSYDDVQIPKTGERLDQTDQYPGPSLDELEVKLEDILEFKIPDDSLEGENNPEADPGEPCPYIVTLDDGTVVNIPDVKTGEAESKEKDDKNGDNNASEIDNTGEQEETETDSPEDNDAKTRELTDEEKQKLKEKLGWPDERFKKCTIDENGVIHYKTDRCDLEGKTSENGVPYERRTIEINGVKIEGVFPKFESAFDTNLDPENYKSKAYAKECNAKLKEAIQNDPELRSKFTPEQLKDIEEGRTPRGYVWHHNEEPGKMQLVKREDHDRAIGGAAHTGGSSLWGPDSVDNSEKGENF